MRAHFGLQAGIQLILTMAGATATAAPSISIVSPALGQKVRNQPKPTMMVTYSSDDPTRPLDLASLAFRVNGSLVPWAFTKGPSSASYTLGPEDQIVAGSVTFSVSIRDVAGAVADAAQTNEVLPSLESITPSFGGVGDTVTIMALGLDPSPSRDSALFTNPFDPAGASAFFATVDQASRTGTLRVPAGAGTGRLLLVVNGERSPETPSFTVPGPVPGCGEIFRIQFTADGGAIVFYRWRGGPDPLCQSVPVPSFEGAVVRVSPDRRTLSVLAQTDLRRFPTHYISIRGFVLDKSLMDPAVIIEEHDHRPGSTNPPLTLRVSYKGRLTVLGAIDIDGVDTPAADFDADGNFYIVHDSSGVGLRLSKVGLTSGAIMDLPTALDPDQQSHCIVGGHCATLVIGCDGFAYVGMHRDSSSPPNFTAYHVQKVELSTGAVVADTGLVDNRFLVDLAVSCHTDELWGSALTAVGFLGVDRDVEAVRFATSASPPSLGPPVRVALLPRSETDSPISIGPEGTVYLHRRDIPTSFTSLVPLPGPPAVPPCGATALPLCERRETGTIAILPSTTRWKPQRVIDPADPLAPIKVNFKGPNDLDPTTVRLEVTPPAGFFGTYTPTKTAVTKVSGKDDEYTFDWTGPWTYEPSPSTTLPMPRGNYKLVVAGKRQNSDTELKNDPPYDKVSLVEVVAIAVEDASGLALGNNPPSHGGGKRIFAEAAQPGGTVTDKLKVTATIFPPVADTPAGQGVSVHFRSFDVDDPSAAAAPVDDESQPTDNCLEATAGPPQNCPVADAGFLYDPATDPNAANPVNGTTGLQLDASGDQAVAGLRVAMLAGANYRVVASTSSQWLGTLSASGNRTDGAVLEGTAVLPEGQQVTPMVTVWRTLHLQPVRMTLPSFPQSTLEHQATAACPTAPCIQGNLLEDTNGIPHPDHGNMTNTWMGADLDVTPATPQGAPRSDKHIVTNSTPTTLTTLTPLTPHDPNFDYALWDDEVDSLSIWSQPDDSLARDILRDAYIEVDTVMGVSPNFKQNLSDAAVAALPTRSTSAPEYWTAPIVLAFEGVAQGQDGDPSVEQYIYGLANGPEAGQTSRWPRVAIYAETIRDYRATPLANAPPNRVPRDEIMTNTTAHEILHIFGVIHDGNRTQGGIMCASLYVDGNETNRRKVTPYQFKQIREATEMKIRRVKVDCP